MVWVILGILYSLFRAAFAESSRLFQVDSNQLNFWHAVFGLVFLSPFIPFIEWGLPVSFYGSAIIVSLVVASGALMQLLMSEQRAARVSGMHVPLEAMMAFCIWGFLMPGVGEELLHNYKSTILTALAFAAMTFGLMRIRTNDFGWRSFMIIIPGALSFGATGVLIKLIITEELLPDAVFVFVFVNYAVLLLVMAGVLLVRQGFKGNIINKKLLQAGAMAGIFSASAYICFIYSVIYTTNPSYTIVLAMLVPVWLLIYHRISNIEDKSLQKPAAIVVAGVMLFIAANF